MYSNNFLGGVQVTSTLYKGWSRCWSHPTLPQYVSVSMTVEGVDAC